MSAQPKAEGNLEIAHILFIDTVGYSKLLINEQHRLLEDLSNLVRATACFQKAEAKGKLIRLPTGDGMALVFADDPEAPVQCAIEVARAAREPNLPLRMGIHSGPVSRVVDVNDQVNFAGSGINTAQRVMNCGDAGHILLSKRAAEDLAEYPHWHDSLRDIGECEVKHATKISLINLVWDDVGNPELPVRLKEELKRRAAADMARRKMSRRRVFTAGSILAVIVAVSIAYLLWARQTRAVAPEKSIAVLPFANLSDSKRDAFFADGIMDEILTDLTNVADLKVISRTSVMQYQGEAALNVRQIGQALNVAYVLEGSVQRDGERVRINVQLIDARTDIHVWAKHYDSELADVFSVQSELAEAIVAQLRAKLSPEEKAAIEEKPTADLVAYEYYTRAKSLYSTTTFNVHEKEKLYEMVQLLNDAVARDRAFFRAYYQLAWANDRLYILGIDHTPARLALAEEAVKTAQRLKPNSGEAHLAAAAHFYSGYRDYDRARRELEAAAPVLPNEPLVFELAAYIDRRQGRWDQCVRKLNKAIEIDPRNSFLLHQISLAYEHMREFSRMVASLDRALLLVPRDPTTQVQRAMGEFEWRGETKPLHSAIQLALQEDPSVAAGLGDSWLTLALCERDQAAATQAVVAMTSDSCRNEGIPIPRSWCEGLAARARGDTNGARAAFSAGRTELEDTVRQQPDYGEALCVLGLFEAALGHKAEAVSAGRRAVELLPISKDAINGPRAMEYLGVIYAWTGEKELAMDQLEAATKVPCDVNYGRLKLHPYWDSLRGDPRFEKLVASLAPK
jgi:TolB-like protein/class 3 adenylate cyclase/Flp pilus assembly protein TadD